MSYPPVSIVVAAYNSQDTIGACIESLLDLDYPEKEIIVVDDGSTDKTAEIAKGYPIKLVSQSKKGASAARNRGLENSNHDIVAYTDSDAEVTRDWLKKLVANFSEDEIGAVTGRTVFAVDKHCTSYIRSLDIDERNARRGKCTALANGPNCAFRKDLLKKVGGFDPSWYHAEDTEVSYRILKEGYKIVYEPEAVVHHTPENDWRDFLRKRYRDAKAFTRMLWFHTSRAFFRDDFVTPNMKVQPFLFALIISSPPLFYFLHISSLFWILFLALGVAMNIPFSYRVSKKSGRASFFVKALLLTTARGFCWGFGLAVGGIKNLRNIYPT